VATPPSNPDLTPVTPPPGANAQQTTRYVYLVSRLRNRQMTMEEATELFGVMQAMLRASELARQAALRAMGSPPPSTPAASARVPGPAGPPGGIPSADDLLMLGILGTGATAGVLAALTKRIQELTAATGGAPGTNTGRRST